MNISGLQYCKMQYRRWLGFQLGASSVCIPLVQGGEKSPGNMGEWNRGQLLGNLSQLLSRSRARACAVCAKGPEAGETEAGAC